MIETPVKLLTTTVEVNKRKRQVIASGKGLAAENQHVSVQYSLQHVHGRAAATGQTKDSQ